MKLFLWKLSQDENNCYETYDSAVVVSHSQEAAAMIHPLGDKIEWNGTDWRWADDGSDFGMDNWSPPGQVKVVLVGEATQGLLSEGDVVCSSYNAG